MTTVQKLRDRVIALKIEKADNAADLSEINGRLKGRLAPAELRRARSLRDQLAADQADIDGELSQLNARILAAVDLERARDLKLHGIRTIAAAIAASRPDVPMPIVVLQALTLEDELQRAVPPVEIPDLPDAEEESIKY